MFLDHNIEVGGINISTHEIIAIYSYIWKWINCVNFYKINSNLILYTHISKYTVNVFKIFIQAMFER